MKTYTYLILAVVVSSILIQPLIEIANVCKVRVQVGTAITNSVRAAQKESYMYTSARDLGGEADKMVFVETFADLFAWSLDLDDTSVTTSSITFQPKNTNDIYNSFKVKCSFSTTGSGSNKQTKVTVESTSDYKFKTKYLRDAQNIIKANGGVYKLNHKRTYVLKMKN